MLSNSNVKQCCYMLWWYWWQILRRTEEENKTKSGSYSCRGLRPAAKNIQRWGKVIFLIWWIKSTINDPSHHFWISDMKHRLQFDFAGSVQGHSLWLVVMNQFIYAITLCKPDTQMQNGHQNYHLITCGITRPSFNSWKIMEQEINGILLSIQLWKNVW